EEMNRKRKGLEEDPGLRYFGRAQLECNEILLSSYQYIVGIGLTGYDQNSAMAALKIYEENQNAPVRFYRYSPDTGMVEITHNDVIAQAQAAKNKVENKVENRNDEQVVIPNEL